MGVYKLSNSGSFGTLRPVYKSMLTGNPGLPLSVEYILVAGGGGTANESTNAWRSGGSGAGGLLTSTIVRAINTNYTVTVGAGGAAKGPNLGAGNNGIDSSIFGVTAIGGGGGGIADVSGNSGGSGGGGGNNTGGGGGTAGQGFGGGSGSGAKTNPSYGGAGGGATGAGQSWAAGSAGGAGLTTSITGSSITLARGGSPGGGSGGGAGEANTGNGTWGTQGGSGGLANPGGSGIVILRYPALYNITIGAGLTGTTATVGQNKVTQITAGTGNISFTN